MTTEPRLPIRWPWLVRGFQRYAVHYVRKHFHAVRLSKTSAPVPTDDTPILVVLNHPSWWDPMLCTVLSLRFPRHEHYPAIDDEALLQYRVFAKLGFFGVDTKSLRGAAAFLRTATHILSAPNRIVWVTAQGRFADVRERPLKLRSGVGHLAARLPRALILPIAIEYPFWSERTPEALVRIGYPIDVAEAPNRRAREWTQRIEEALTETLDGLNAEALTRSPDKFEPLIAGKVGVGGMYDFVRRIGSWVRGRRFDPTHDAEGRS